MEPAGFCGPANYQAPPCWLGTPTTVGMISISHYHPPPISLILKGQSHESEPIGQKSVFQAVL